MALWRVEEAAEFLGIRPKTLYEWVRTDRVPYRKLGFNVRFDPEELEEWVREQPAGGRRSSRDRGGSVDERSEAVPASPSGEQVAELVDAGAAAARRLHRVESDLGAQLSFPQRQELRELAQRLQKAVDAVRPDEDGD